MGDYCLLIIIFIDLLYVYSLCYYILKQSLLKYFGKYFFNN